MAKQKKEVAVINFEEFSVAQLPELHGKKEEIKSVIDANPVVEVIDNASYELAKKSRTAVKTLRTSLEKEKKEVNDRIKKNVLEVVANEYDSLIAGVKNDENARQEHVTSWEEKKESERLEKIRLEEERVLGIKNSIIEFGEVWIKAFMLMKFENIDEAKKTFEESVDLVNASEFKEFEILFIDKVSYLENLLDSKIKTLTEQENIRLEQIRLAEERKKQEEEAKRIAEEQAKEKAKWEAEQKAIAEKQRIAQEKFQKEKAEFEAKQAEAKFQERKKFLVDEDYWRIYLLTECAEEEDISKGKLLNFTDSEFEDFKLAVLKSKELVTKIKEVEFEEKATENYHEEDVHEIAKPKNALVPMKLAKLPNGETVWATKEGVEYLESNNSKEELTWELIHDSFVEETEIDDSINFYYWLKENYNVPTPKH